MRSPLKRALNTLCLVLVAIPAFTCWVGQALVDSDAVFNFWAHAAACLPGVPGQFLRRAFYRWTLASCADDVTIEFGAVLTRRSAVLERGVYVGMYALVGWAWVREHSMIGSRASLLSGARQHEWTAEGRWTPTDPSTLTRVTIGANTWVGEGAIVMADVGAGCMVAAGAVVSSAVPDGVMVASNPARFVRRVAGEAAGDTHGASAPPAVR